MANGHQVDFFEKRHFLRKPYSTSDSPLLTLHGSGHLLHHQLKIFSLLNEVDASYLSRVFRRQIRVDEIDVVLNFCYDLYFLRRIFPKTPIVHIVNDDYISSAIAPHKRSARRLLHKSAQRADHNLVVSYSIQRQILEATDNVSMFFPWARHQYERPPHSENRDEVLYWGFINDRIDAELAIGIMDQGIKINFVGSITPSRCIESILAHPNAVSLGVRALSDIPDILRRCGCAIIPYDINNAYNPAVTISNRGFELLSFGMPLVFSNLPNLIKAPDSIIMKSADLNEFHENILRTQRAFDDVQITIEEYLQDHTPDARYRQLMDVIEKSKIP